MKAEGISTKSIEIEIKELELHIARLELDLSKKRQERRDLQELQEKESIGSDCHERLIREGDTVRILTPSKSGLFKGETHAVVIGRSRRHLGRILIGITDNLNITTNRESHNVEVTESRHDRK